MCGGAAAVPGSGVRPCCCSWWLHNSLLNYRCCDCARCDMQSRSATAGAPRRLLSWRRWRRRSEGLASPSKGAAATLLLALLPGQQPAAWYRCSSARRGAASLRPTDEPRSPAWRLAAFWPAKPYAWQSQYALKRTTAGNVCVCLCVCVCSGCFFPTPCRLCAGQRCAARRGRPAGGPTFVLPIAALYLLLPLCSPLPFTTAHRPSVRLSLPCDRRSGRAWQGRSMRGRREAGGQEAAAAAAGDRAGAKRWC